MLQDLTIMNWDYSGTFLKLKQGKAYALPSKWAKELQQQGYCYFVVLNARSPYDQTTT